MAPYADIQSVIDFNETANTLHSEAKSYPLHLESSPRKVCFSKSVVVYDVEGAADYSEEEREASWYSIKELREIKNNMKDDLFKMASGKLELSRGLEGRTKEGFEQKYHARTSSWMAVFREQDQQDIDGYEDPEYLAGVYHQHTTVSQCLAVLRGKQDEKAARE